MIRVGFIINDNGDGWTGGLNYLTNLLYAIDKVNDRQIEPVLIVSPTTSLKVLALFPPWQVLRTVLVGGQHRIWTLAQKLCKLLLGRDVLIERFLKRNCIDVLSHSGSLGRDAVVPTIGWIPDFQHRRMPELFSPRELAVRDRDFRRIAEQCTTVLLSSEDALNDLAKFVPAAVPASRVLHFVAGFAGGATPVVDEVALRARYGIVGPYFHLPNQFWVHKNHRVVIDALALLKDRGHEVVVTCTGHNKDYRRPGYFEELVHHAEEQGVTDRFRVLGLVPYEDMVSLMRHSVGVINPSLFEGWSTTVEETKSLGLTVILSDIPVHREQNPDRGIFFDPCNPQNLADTLASVLEQYSIGDRSTYQAHAKEYIVERFSLFGRKYQSLVLEAFLKTKL